MWIFVKKYDFLKEISGKIEHLDPDPYSKYGLGSWISSPTNTDPIRIRSGYGSEFETLFVEYYFLLACEEACH